MSTDPVTRDVKHVRTQYNVDRVRRDFPALQQKVYGKPLVYLDNAATSQKPRQVIETVNRYYSFDNSNVHRGVHALSQRATAAYEGARERVAELLAAGDSRQIVFVRGATEGVNLVAQTFGREHVGEGDEVMISEMEHHSNIVPWQILCEQRKAKLVVIPMNDAGELRIDEYDKLLGDRTKMVALVHVSNSLGTVNPVKSMIARAHTRGIPVLVDGAQATPHIAVDVQDLDADFYVFSSHKMYGPTGVGVVYGKLEHMETMPPYQSGGDMIASVTFDKTTYNVLPHRFEAGTPDVAGVIGFGAAIDYIEGIGYPGIAAHEQDLVEYATEGLTAVPGLSIIGTAKEKAGIVSFVLDGIHPHDIGTVLDREGIAVRTGHHCTQPVMDHFGVPATSRASFGIYNTRAEVDSLVAAVRKVREVFG